MTPKILLTSFATWLPHQKSNSSDDLLQEISKLDSLPWQLIFLRQLPVDIQQASDLTIAAIAIHQPDLVVNCGMAEKRYQLTIESNARCGSAKLATAINLQALIAGTTKTAISDDAGQFVCEGLYYSVLDYCQHHRPIANIFVHVPVLNSGNLTAIAADFLLILQNLAIAASSS